MLNFKVSGQVNILPFGHSVMENPCKYTAFNWNHKAKRLPHWIILSIMLQFNIGAQVLSWI